MRIIKELREGVLEVRIVKDLEAIKEAKEVKDVKENARAAQWLASRTGRADWSLANTRGRIPRRVSIG